MSWTSDNIDPLDDTTALVTGPDSGIGYQVTKALAEHGATVIMAAKTEQQGQEARNDLETKIETPDLSVIECDLGDLESIETATTNVHEQTDTLDILCNNAGVMALPYQETADGFEYQMGVNHLGHFALTLQLLPLLTAGEQQSRVITQSSGMHERGQIDPTDLMPEEYDRWQAYANSKLANILFAYELDRKAKTHDRDLVSVATHPGYADTNLQYRGPKQDGNRIKTAIMRIMGYLFAQSPAAGALPMLYAATETGIDGRTYWGPDGLMNMRGSPEQQQSSDQSYDTVLAQDLWEQSEQLTGCSFTESLP
ncbi:MAG: oxidoreductase [Candidatus Nanohaloarchaeota archaeon QJJ-5]|nr:oxidoreductase [Candidatus Nanohaloarchaeota archaeon QJJ-5]